MFSDIYSGRGGNWEEGTLQIATVPNANTSQPSLGIFHDVHDRFPSIVGAPPPVVVVVVAVAVAVAVDVAVVAYATVDCCLGVVCGWCCCGCGVAVAFAPLFCYCCL